MAIAGVGYGYGTGYDTHWNSRIGKTAAPVSTQTRVQESGNINLNWSDGAIYANGTPDGQNFSIYKAEGYSADHPLLTVSGTNQEGKSYE